MFAQAMTFRLSRRFTDLRPVALAGCLLVLGAVVAAFVSDAAAQATCISPAVGVPFNNGPPRWYQGANPLDSRIDDPRWKTAASITHGSGTVEEVNFRALHHSDTLYLSWWVKVAPTADYAKNVLYVGLQPKGGGTALLLKIKLNSLSALDNADYMVTLNTVDAAGNFTAMSPSSQPWMNDIRVWINLPISNRWAINVRVPTKTDLTGGSGIVLTPGIEKEFRMWYEVLQGTPVAPTGIVYTWPRVGFSVTGFTEVTPAPLTWPLFHKSIGFGDPSCASGGIDIESSDIFMSGANRWLIDTLNPNTFHATPTNLTGSPINIGDLHARFRVANWGLQADPNNVSDPSTLWQDVRGLGDVTQGGAGTIAPGAKWDIQKGYDYSPVLDPHYDNITHWDHQCILVDLFGPNLVFLRNSAHTNMNFGHASEFQDRAQINLTDALALPSGAPNRTVYLYVHTTNMPEVVVKGGGAPPSRDTTARPRPDSQAIGRNPAAVTPGPLPGGWDTTDNTRYHLPVNEQLAESLPTITVHGYYESGDTVAIDGQKRAMLVPMTSFGYFIKHDGPVTGWKYGLAGAGVVQVAPNFYKVVMPAKGTATIKIQVKAQEPGGPLLDWLRHLPWWVWLILIALILLFLWLRKKS